MILLHFAKWEDSYSIQYQTSSLGLTNLGSRLHCLPVFPSSSFKKHVYGSLIAHMNTACTQGRECCSISLLVWHEACDPCAARALRVSATLLSPHRCVCTCVCVSPPVWPTALHARNTHMLPFFLPELQCGSWQRCNVQHLCYLFFLLKTTVWLLAAVQQLYVACFFLPELQCGSWQRCSSGSGSADPTRREAGHTHRFQHSRGRVLGRWWATCS